eukprot:scaffold140758_cov26-Tisochrysis_lutea.AAC.2
MPPRPRRAPDASGHRPHRLGSRRAAGAVLPRPHSSPPQCMRAAAPLGTQLRPAGKQAPPRTLRPPDRGCLARHGAWRERSARRGLARARSSARTTPPPCTLASLSHGSPHCGERELAVERSSNARWASPARAASSPSLSRWRAASLTLEAAAEAASSASARITIPCPPPSLAPLRESDPTKRFGCNL